MNELVVISFFVGMFVGAASALLGVKYGMRS